MPRTKAAATEPDAGTPVPVRGLSDNHKQILGLLVTFLLDKVFEYLETKKVFALQAPQPAADAPPQPPPEPQP